MFEAIIDQKLNEHEQSIDICTENVFTHNFTEYHESVEHTFVRKPGFYCVNTSYQRKIANPVCATGPAK